MRRILCALIAALGFMPAAFGQEALTLVRTIELPRVEGRIDHLAIDATNQRLFVAALGNNTVEVVDLRMATHARSLPGFHEPQGIALDPESKAVAVANGQSGDLVMLDSTDFHRTKTIPLGEDADNVRYDAATKRLYVGYGSGALAVIDATNGRRLGEVKLAGHPESFQLETSGPRIFVNVPDASQIAVVDRNALKVLATWPVAGAASNFPMALDEAGHRLFIGCRRPAKVLVYDSSSGKQAGSFDIVGDTDDIFYDATRKRLFVTGGDGFADVVQEVDAGHFSRVVHLPTAAGARTSLFVPMQNRLYVAVPHRGNQRSEIRIYESRS